MKAIEVTDEASETAGMTPAKRPRPEAAGNDVLVEVHASGFTGELSRPSTWTDRLGPDRTPSIPGHELAGVVSALATVRRVCAGHRHAGRGTHRRHPVSLPCADAAYGRNPDLRAFCHDNQVGYVLAVPLDVPLIDVRGQTELAGHVLDRLLAHGDSSMCERRACGSGTKGLRLYDWSAIAVTVSG